MVAYDLDGVLALGPPASSKPWGRMKGHERLARTESLIAHYALAAPLFDPPEDRFCVITARKGTPDVQRETEDWLAFRFGNRVAAVYFLTKPRTIRNVVAFKSSVLLKIGAQEFTEDNSAVLRGIEAISGMENCHLWLYKQGERTDFRLVGRQKT